MTVSGCGNAAECGVCSIGKVVYRQLNFPYAVSTIAAMLLEDPGLAGCQPQRQLLNHLIQTGV